MKIRRLIAVIALSVCAASAYADDADQFVLPDGLEAKTWAQSPQFFNPTNIDIDARGRIWVAEAVNYRETLHPLHALKHPDGDRIMILEDTDGDGKCDSSKVFVEDKDLVAPLGVAVLGNKVIVSCSPNVIVYEDTDGDDKADKKQIFLTGFGGFDIDHGVHSFVGFLDGRWYFNVGNEGPQHVKDAGGWTLNSGMYAAMRGKNTPNQKSDDGRVWTAGLALRIDPDGKHLTPIGHNFRNCYEFAIDSFGDMWQSDNDDDGNQSCRFSWLMEGANMGYASADGTRNWKLDQRPGQPTPTAHWHQDDPGVLPSGDITGAGGPTGVVAYEGGLLPQKYVGCLLDADAGRNVVRVHRPIPDGTGFKFERSDLIKLKDPSDPQAKWFRPSDVAIGTDGAIYVADWYDPVVGGHDMKDKAGGGRILRIAPRGDHTKPPKIDLRSLDGQLAALNSPAINVRYAAAMELRQQGDAATEKLVDWLEGDNPVARARAIWVIGAMEARGAGMLQTLLKHRDERVRLTALRALRWNGGVDVTTMASDPSPAVRREVAIALRDVPYDKCADALLNLARGYDGHDRFYLEALGEACDRKESPAYAMLLAAIGDSDSLKWSDAMAGIAWRLHPIIALDAMAKRATATSLSAAARKQAVDAIAFMRDEKAADTMARLADGGPDDVKPIAAWWLKDRGGNDWQQYAVAKKAAEEGKVADTRAIADALNADRNLILDDKAKFADRKSTAVRMAKTHDGAIALIELASDGKFPNDLLDATSDAIYRNKDLGVRGLASKYFPRKNTAGSPLPPIAELAKVPGDIDRGRVIFAGKAGGCSKCHSFDGEGKDVGPDLTSIRTKYARPQLLDAILNPSANIAFGYEPWVIKTADGQVYCGFIIADGKELVLKESTGDRRTIPVDQVKLRKKQDLSIMPDNIALGMTAQDLADLSEFLLKAWVHAPATTTKPIAAGGAP